MKNVFYHFNANCVFFKRIDITIREKNGRTAGRKRDGQQKDIRLDACIVKDPTIAQTATKRVRDTKYIEEETRRWRKRKTEE